MLGVADGDRVGLTVGSLEGLAVVGVSVGVLVTVGNAVEGLTVGDVKPGVGRREEGEADGDSLGFRDGVNVEGISVGVNVEGN